MQIVHMARSSRRLLLALDPDERAGSRVRRGLQRLEAAAAGRLGARLGAGPRVSVPASTSKTGTLVRRTSSFSTWSRRALILADALA